MMSIRNIGDKHHSFPESEVKEAKKSFKLGSDKLTIVFEEANQPKFEHSSKDDASGPKLPTRVLRSLQAKLTSVQEKILAVARAAQLFIDKRKDPRVHLKALVENLKNRAELDSHKPMKTADDLREKLATYLGTLRALRRDLSFLSSEDEKLLAMSKKIGRILNEVHHLKPNSVGQAKASAKNILSANKQTLKVIDRELMSIVLLPGRSIFENDEMSSPSNAYLERAKILHKIHDQLAHLAHAQIASKVFGTKSDNQRSGAILKDYSEKLNEVYEELSHEALSGISSKILGDIEGVESSVVELRGELQALNPNT